MGALWSAPIRLITIPTIAATMVLAADGVLTMDSILQWQVIMSGVGASVALRLLDNLLVEFVVFPGALKIFRRGS